MFSVTEISKLIELYGDEIVSPANISRVKGIFTKSSDLLPSLLPYVDKDKEYLGFYSKAGDIPMGIYIYADKQYIAVARKTVKTLSKPAFCQTLLRYMPPAVPTPQEPEPTVYPNTMTFGDFSIELDIEEVKVKQGSLVVNVAAVNKFVTDSVVGSEPMEVIIKGKVTRELANDLLITLKNPSSKSRQTLTLDGLISIYAVVKEFELTQSKTEEKEDFKIVFTEVRIT